MEPNHTTVRILGPLSIIQSSLTETKEKPGRPREKILENPKLALFGLKPVFVIDGTVKGKRTILFLLSSDLYVGEHGP